LENCPEVLKIKAMRAARLPLLFNSPLLLFFLFNCSFKRKNINSLKKKKKEDEKNERL